MSAVQFLSLVKPGTGHNRAVGKRCNNERKHVRVPFEMKDRDALAIMRKQVSELIRRDYRTVEEFCCTT